MSFFVLFQRCQECQMIFKKCEESKNLYFKVNQMQIILFFFISKLVCNFSNPFMLKILQRILLDQYVVLNLQFLHHLFYDLLLFAYLLTVFYSDICGFICRFAQNKKRGYKLILMHLSIIYLIITERSDKWDHIIFEFTTLILNLHRKHNRGAAMAICTMWQLNWL